MNRDNCLCLIIFAFSFKNAFVGTTVGNTNTTSTEGKNIVKCWRNKANKFDKIFRNMRKSWPRYNVHSCSLVAVYLSHFHFPHHSLIFLTCSLHYTLNLDSERKRKGSKRKKKNLRVWHRTYTTLSARSAFRAFTNLCRTTTM